MAEGKLPIAGTAMDAWGDALRVVSAMPALAGIAFVVLLLISGANLLLLPDMLNHSKAYPPVVHILGVVTIIVQSFLLAPLAIAVHRMVLLGETTDRYTLDLSSLRYRRFVVFGILVTLLWMLPSILIDLEPHSSTGLSTAFDILVFVLLIVLAIVTLRRIILFPAIAVDAPGATWSNARNDTKGHSWRVLFIFVCALLPLVVMAIPLTLVGRPHFGAPGKFVLAIVRPGLQIFGLAVCAAAASHLFKAYASRMINPRGGGPAPVTAAD